MSNLENKKAVDSDGKVYEITQHRVESDELVLKRGSETQAITMMDIADGPYEVVGNE